jgi:hypothetical protein
LEQPSGQERQEFGVGTVIGDRCIHSHFMGSVLHPHADRCRWTQQFQFGEDGLPAPLDVLGGGGEEFLQVPAGVQVVGRECAWNRGRE